MAKSQQDGGGTGMNARQWTQLVLLSVLWGGSFFFISVAVTGLPPFTVMLLRVGLAGLALWVVLLMTGQQAPAGRGCWVALTVMGILNNVVPQTLIVWGEQSISGGLASILNATTPFFTVIVGQIFTHDEKITGLKLLGLLIGFAGVTIMVGPGMAEGSGTRATAILAQIAILAASLCYGLSAVYGRRFKTMGLSPLATSTGQLTASTCLLLPLVLMFDQPFSLPVPSTPVLLAISGLALLSTALAYILFFQILATAGSTNLSLVTFLIPISAILLGWLFMGEQLEPRHFLGLAGIAFGLAAIDGRLFRRWLPNNS